MERIRKRIEKGIEKRINYLQPFRSWEELSRWWFLFSASHSSTSRNTTGLCYQWFVHEITSATRFTTRSRTKSCQPRARLVQIPFQSLNLQLIAIHFSIRFLICSVFQPRPKNLLQSSHFQFTRWSYNSFTATTPKACCVAFVYLHFIISIWKMRNQRIRTTM